MVPENSHRPCAAQAQQRAIGIDRQSSRLVSTNRLARACETRSAHQRKPMQIVVRFETSPESYVAGSEQTQARAPERCPTCARAGSLRAHGYYHRNTTDTEGRAIAISVRRFKCHQCLATLSCLPNFAQPYRFINSLTIQHSFAGRALDPAVCRNSALLRRYWKRFRLWSETMWPGAVPNSSASHLVFARLMANWGNLAICTQMMVLHWRVTCFGVYRCHQRAGERSEQRSAPDLISTHHTTCPFHQRQVSGSVRTLTDGANEVRAGPATGRSTDRERLLNGSQIALAERNGHPDTTTRGGLLPPLGAGSSGQQRGYPAGPGSQICR